MCKFRISHGMAGALCGFLDYQLEGTEVLMQLRGTLSIGFLGGAQQHVTGTPRIAESQSPIT